MCEMINFSEYKGNKRVAKKSEQVSKSIKKVGANGLSTENLIKEFVENERSVLKLVLYIIEQYGRIGEDGLPFEEVKRDMKYCDICPEIENKKLKAPLGVKINGEWYAVEVATNSSSYAAFWRKWETIGDYNMKGFFIDVSDMNRGDMKYFLSQKYSDFCLKEIVDNVHRFYLNGKSVFPFERKSFVEIGRGGTRITCLYKMKELFNGFVILEGTEVDTGAKHMLLLCKGKMSMRNII